MQQRERKRWETWKRGWAAQSARRPTQMQLDARGSGETRGHQSQSSGRLRVFSCYESYQSSDPESQQVPWRIQRNAHPDRLSHHRHTHTHTHTHTHPDRLSHHRQTHTDTHTPRLTKSSQTDRHTHRHTHTLTHTQTHTGLEVRERRHGP